MTKCWRPQSGGRVPPCGGWWEGLGRSQVIHCEGVSSSVWPTRPPRGGRTGSAPRGLTASFELSFNQPASRYTKYQQQLNVVTAGRWKCQNPKSQ